MAKLTDLGRIDRAVADNLSDIKDSFDEYSGIVQDFIVFISQQITYDLFGFTTFTISDFCKSSGRNRQQLAIKHPLFTNTKKKPPQIDGFDFETVFDYALIVMLQRNLVFKKVYQTKENNRIIHLESIRILSDVRIELDKSNKGVKRYKVKISSELLNGFIKRYYTLDNKAYSLIGKGKGGDNRKTFIIYLSRLRHILWSTKQEEIVLPVDEICRAADIIRSENKHKKEAVNRLLKAVKEKSKFFLNYEFVSNGSYSYYVRLEFGKPTSYKAPHNFYLTLMNQLEDVYNNLKKPISNNIEPFQEWLTNHNLEYHQKITAIRYAYKSALAINLSENEAFQILKYGLKP